MTDSPVLLCTDMDRTLLPNGAQAESPEARPRLRALTARPEVTLAYVTGRHLELVLQAIAEYDVPVPDMVIGDVGTSLFLRADDGAGASFSPFTPWWDVIGAAWAGASAEDLAALFADLPALTLQEPEKQSRYKLSYYADAALDPAPLIAEMQGRLAARGMAAEMIWSVDETGPTGLLDVIPPGADKLGAVRFLMDRRGFDLTNTVFCGDSGNDLPVLASAVPGVLVANATSDVAAQAVDLAKKNATLASLYMAQGNFMGMNGNYAAGILEGLAHFRPETAGWYA